MEGRKRIWKDPLDPFTQIWTPLDPHRGVGRIFTARWSLLVILCSCHTLRYRAGMQPWNESMETAAPPCHHHYPSWTTADRTLAIVERAL